MDYLQGWPSYEIQRFLEEFRAKSEPVTEENKTIRFVSLFLSDEAVEATEHGWEGQPEREGKGKGKASPKGKGKGRPGLARGKGRPGRKIRRRFLGQRDRLAETTVGRTVTLIHHATQLYLAYLNPENILEL